MAMISLLSGFVYRQCVRNYSAANFVLRAYGRLCGYMRQLILKVFNPSVRMKIGQRKLVMSLSHEIPLNMASHVCYNTAIVRIAAFLKENHKYLTMLDVGANIGDTVSLIAEAVDGRFLCVEADEKYYQHLLLNMKGINNVHCVKVLCDQEDGTSNISFDRAGGSSHVTECEVGGDIAIDRVTVDSLVRKLAMFRDANFIKVDTDGYDYRVMKGCDGLIADSRPAFFFELSPTFLREAGEDPLSIFDYLLDRGYRTALFYDNVGFPAMILKANETAYICQLIDYADRKQAYFDVLVFHDSQEDNFRRFCENEMKLFEQKLD